MRLINYFFLFTICFLISSCGAERKPKFVKSPLDNIITKYIDKSDYSVILADMDYKEDTDKYFHKYRILIEEKQPQLSIEALNDTISNPTDIKIIDTEWKEVSPITFEEHQNDLGMTVLSKKNGVLDKNSAPAGVNNYVGNPKYGEWKTHSNGSSFGLFTVAIVYFLIYFLAQDMVTDMGIQETIIMIITEIIVIKNHTMVVLVNTVQILQEIKILHGLKSLKHLRAK